MPLIVRFALLGALLAAASCAGDHYEGGGRRRELPTTAGQNAPPVGLGDPNSTMGGGSNGQLDAGLAGDADIANDAGDAG